MTPHGRPESHLGPHHDPRRDLRADCSQCLGLCCVAPAFAASADFAIDKPAGRPCPNLQPDLHCGIHDRLREKGFPGCDSYDCFGAGQRLSQVTFAGHDWRDDPDVAARMFDALPVVRALHELLWYLAEALTLPAAQPLHPALQAAVDRTRELAGLPAPALPALDVSAHRGDVNALLLRASELSRAEHPPAGRDLRGADLIGADLRGADLRAASLRGARLIGADLRGADLRRADLIGADLRGADLRGVDLTGALFLTGTQVNAARGDQTTLGLPPVLSRPAHWAGEGEGDGHAPRPDRTGPHFR